MAYEGTTVDPSRSQEQVLTMLRKHGADQFSISEGLAHGGRWIKVEFVFQDHMVRIVAPVALPDPKEVAAAARRARKKTASQIEDEMATGEVRRIWRVVLNSIKAKLVDTEDGLMTFHQAFLPYLVDPKTNTTLWENLEPYVTQGALSLSGSGLELGPGGM